ncbi:hypothetical protein [Capnocytophaga sp.]|uniref:hypothetical protein n=1 Tax=Capnocytophaga sp. TaxID=44737 RepID=UPI0026DC5E17|nr:hypothetical protein [Capnocytophaga sp.]MDO5105333.1 hypothetical protein [Capnocytophaga sp.]
MKKSDVPQEKGALGSIQELCYATDDNGNYTTELSSGWGVKSAALEESLRYIEEQIEEAEKLVAQGKKSPVVYYMTLCRMDWKTLAGYMNRWQWIVKRHAKPGVFTQLSEKTLRKYAKIFDITVDELKNPLFLNKHK